MFQASRETSSGVASRKPLILPPLEKCSPTARLTRALRGCPNTAHVGQPSANWPLLQLPTQLTVEGVRPAAAKRNGKQDEAPEQRVFPAAPSSGKSCGPMRDERDDCELHGESSCKETRE